MPAIGELIRKIRTDKGMTQREASRGILSRSHLSELEHNDYYPHL
ncbi:MAG: helix-turn-helix domain-containing protein [Sporolactobacillus sp.]